LGRRPLHVADRVLVDDLVLHRPVERGLQDGDGGAERRLPPRALVLALEPATDDGFGHLAREQVREVAEEVFEEDTIPCTRVVLDAALSRVEERLEQLTDGDVARRGGLPALAEESDPGPLDLRRGLPALPALLRSGLGGVLAEPVLLAARKLDVPAPRLLAEPRFLHFSCTFGPEPSVPLAVTPYAVSSWGSRIRT